MLYFIYREMKYFFKLKSLDKKNTLQNHHDLTRYIKLHSEVFSGVMSISIYILNNFNLA